MSVIADLAVKVGADISGALSGLGKVDNKIAGLGTTAFGAAADVTKAFAGLGLAVGAAMAGAGAAGVKMAGDLEQSVANISTIKPEIDTSAVFGALNQMSTRIPQTAAQIGDAVYDIFSSLDIGQNEAIALVEKFSKAAVGAQTDVKTFGAAAMGVLNAYKLSVEDADHISDVFFNTVNRGVVTGQELAAGLGPAVASAKAIGVSYEELMAMIAGATKEGGPAAQNINNVKNLLDKVSTKEAIKEFNALGIAVTDNAGKMRSPIDILGDLKERTDNMTDSARNLAIQAIFPDAQARQGAQVIMSQLDMVKDTLEDNRTAVGTTESAYKKMSSTFNSQSKLLLNTFNSILTTIGAELLPMITPVVSAFSAELPHAFALMRDAARPAFQVFTDSIETVKQVFAGEWVSADGINPVTNAVGLLATAVRDAIPVVQSLGGGLGKMLTGDVSGGFAKITATLAPFVARIQEALSALAPTGERIGRLVNALAPLGAALSSTTVDVGTAKTAWQTFADVVNTISAIVEGVVDAINAVISPFVALTNFVKDHVAVQAGLVAGLTAVAIATAWWAATTTAAGLAAGSGAVATGIFYGALGAYAAAAWAIQTATAAWTTVQWAINAALSANPIGVVVVALAALAAGFVYAYNNSEEFRSAIDALGPTCSIIAQGMSAVFGRAFAITSEGLTGLAGSFDVGLQAVGKIIERVSVIAQEKFAAISSAISSATSAASTAIAGLIAQVEALIRSIGGLLSSIASIPSSISLPSVPTPNLSIPGRALGGPVLAGERYIVGEHGPEMFVPRQSGTIIPNGGGAPAPAQESGPKLQPVNLHLTIGGQTIVGAFMADPSALDKFQGMLTASGAFQLSRTGA